METDDSGSFYNYLPEGCRLCYMGAKMVLFVTGMCGKNCYYCPISYERREKDSVYANERPVKSDEDVIGEAVSMEALGTGITGGEPLFRLDRVLHYIRLLKYRFGDSHHIHMYTALAPNFGTLESLKDAGLDEIRFHPPPNFWSNIGDSFYKSSITWAHRLGLSAGIEVPALPSDLSGILSLLDEVDGFLNLNELEFSDTNVDVLKLRGFTPVDDISAAASGSREVAESQSGRKIHFCSSRFKNGVQLRERFKRTARRTAREFDEITDDGTIIYGVIDGKVGDVLKEAGVTEDMYAVVNGFTETAGWLASDLAGELRKMGYNAWVIERYPVKNGMVVEKTPL